MTVAIDASCTACGMCLATCPTHALRRARHRPEVIDDRCIDCWECLEICPVDAIRGGRETFPPNFAHRSSPSTSNGDRSGGGGK